MRKLICIFVAAMLVFSSCAGDIFIEPEYCPLEPFFRDRSLLYGETLTITVPTLIPFFVTQMQAAIRALEQELEDVNVTIHLNVIDDTTPELSIFQQLVNLELMAGTLNGLVMLDNSWSFGERGIDWRNPEVSSLFFTDMWPLLRADPEFNNENFVHSIFEAFTLGDGSLRVVPHAVAFDSFRANRAIPGLEESFLTFESVTIDDLHELHDRYVAGSHHMFLAYSPMHVAQVLASEFLDVDNMAASFDSDRFVDLMVHALEMTNPARDEAMRGLWVGRGGIVQPEAMHSATYAFMSGRPLLHAFEHVPLAGHTSLFSPPIPYTNSDGALLIHPFMPFAISAHSSYEERVLAWKLIKHFACVERFTPDGFSEAIHINRHTTHKNIYFSVTSWYIGGQFGNHFARQTGLFLDVPEDEALERVMDFYRKASNMPMVLQNPYRRAITYAIESATEAIGAGVVLPSQAAASLQNRVMLILMEGN